MTPEIVAVPAGRWRRVSRGYGRWGLWHYAPNRVNPDNGFFRGHGTTGICDADLYRLFDNHAQHQDGQPSERVCRKCVKRVNSPASEDVR
jgi:hypothetical protein